jgi:O-antigen/teichoic acid export membrane protein
MGPNWNAAGQAALPLLALMAISTLMLPSSIALIAAGKARLTLYASLAGMILACTGALLFRPADPRHAVLIWTISQLLVSPYNLWVNARALGVNLLRPLTGGFRVRAIVRMTP